LTDFPFIDRYGRHYKNPVRVHPEDDYLSNVLPAYIATLPKPPQYRDIFYAKEGANIERFENRMFVGAATYNDGNKPNVEKDWLTNIVNWPVYSATAAILSPVGRIALTVGSETYDLDPIDANTTQITIGLSAFAFANNVGSYPDDYFSAYGLYSEGRVYAGSPSTAFAAELEAINLTGGTVGNPTPYHDLFISGTQGLRIGSGGGQGLNPADALAALTIVNNEAKFQGGLIFNADSITGTDGVTGFGSALMFAKGHTIDWYYDNGLDGARATFITSTATQPVNSFQFQNNGALFVTPAGKIAYAFGTVNNSVNGLGLQSSIAAISPYLETFGDDATVPLGFKPKNRGNIENYTDVLLFMSNAGNQLSAVKNQVADPAKFKLVQFTDTGVEFYGNTTGLMFTVAHVNNAVNYMSASPAIAGAHPRLDTFGTSANIDLELHFTGTGTLSLYTPTSNSASAGGAAALPALPATYITIKSGGTTMKIPAYNA